MLAKSAQKIESILNILPLPELYCTEKNRLCRKKGMPSRKTSLRHNHAYGKNCIKTDRAQPVQPELAARDVGVVRSKRRNNSNQRNTIWLLTQIPLPPAS